MGEWAAKEEQAAYYRRLHEITRVDRCGGPVESPAGEASSASGDEVPWCRAQRLGMSRCCLCSAAYPVHFLQTGFGSVALLSVSLLAGLVAGLLVGRWLP